MLAIVRALVDWLADPAQTGLRQAFVVSACAVGLQSLGIEPPSGPLVGCPIPSPSQWFLEHQGQIRL
ncbi:MAG: hypothetical protein MZV65_07025 [Chromatiales bacterium]|nr:hypothetical protein [Chromatiales bacterium]